jgi:Flp pilus assembly protein TadG
MARDASGLAAVEFALILPVMIVLIFGIFETSQALAARADVVNLTSAAADLVAQEGAVTNADITNVYAAATEMLYPFPRTGDDAPSIRITSIVDDGLGVKNSATGITPPHSSGKVGWVCIQAGSGDLDTTVNATVGQTVNLVQPIMIAGGSVIRVEVAYKYSSITTHTIAGSLNMSSAFFTKPRRVAQITGPPNKPC